MAEFNQKNLSQISMIKMDDRYQIAGKKSCATKSRDFVFSFRPMYYFSRAFGLLPFSLEFDLNGELQAPKIRIFDGVWFATCVTFYLVLSFDSWQAIEIKNDEAPLISYINNSLLLTIGLSNGALLIILNMCIRFRFVKILKTFITFDKEASQ